MRAAIIRKHPDRTWLLPVFNAAVSAGDPQPVEEYLEGEIDLTSELVKHPGSTFGVRVTGESMTEDHIFPNDLLIVDRELEPEATDIVIVIVDNELTVKRLSRVGNRLWLIASNKSHSPREVKKHQHCEIWGVVTANIHKFR